MRGRERRRRRAGLLQGPLRDAPAGRTTWSPGPAAGGARDRRARGDRVPEGAPSTEPAAAARGARSLAPRSTALACASAAATTATSPARRRRCSSALEGRRPWPRPKPPLPAAVGFDGRPTLVQNVETLSRVPAARGRSRGLPPRRDDARHRVGRCPAAGRARGAARHAARRGGRARRRRDGTGRTRLPWRPRRRRPCPPPRSTRHSTPTRCAPPAVRSGPPRCS